MDEAQYIAQLQQGDTLLTRGDWNDAFAHFEQMYLRHGAEPNVLFGMGVSSAQRGDHQRAARLIADACLRRLVLEWLVWLARAYDQLNYVLPAYVILYFLVVRQKNAPDHIIRLYVRTQERMRMEFLQRKIDAPTFAGPLAPTPAAREIQRKVANLLKEEKNVEALAVAIKALRQFPENPYLLQNAGLAEKRLRQYEKALVYYLRAFVQNPLDEGIITNIGNLLVAAQSPQEAMLLLEAGAIIRREDGLLWGNLAVAYNAMRVAPWEGEFAARRALEYAPDNASHWGALSSALARQGRMAESLVAWDEVVKCDPSKRFDNLFQIQYAEHLSADEVASHHLHFGEQLSAKVTQLLRPFDNVTGDATRKLRMGWVSGDLKAHPVAYFVEPLLLNIDRQQIEIFLYQNAREDEVSLHFKQHCDRWLNVEALDDDALEAQIREDCIDILWDLSGHTAHNRLNVFARRSAPVQLTWLGHPNTSGLKTMDWRLTDAFCDPPGADHRYAEKLLRLTTHATYAPLVKTPELRNFSEYAVNETPALAVGQLTFGCCNNLSKISDTAVRLWSEILMQVKDSRLLLEAPGLHQREFCRNVIARFESHGVAAERLLLISRVNEMQYKRYHDIDIALDPFPYNGGTTTCDLLWMGVPLVTLAGDSCVSRLGVSFLSNIGHPEWIAATHDEYVRIAATLAADIHRLNRIRLGLRAEVEASPLMNGAAFAREVEQSMRQIWTQYAAASKKGVCVT